MRLPCYGRTPSPACAAQSQAARHADTRCNPRRQIPAWVHVGAKVSGHNWDGTILEVDLFTGDVLISDEYGEDPVWIDIEDLYYIATPEEET